MTLIFNSGYYLQLGFTGGSDGKEYAYNAQDMALSPGLGRSPEEGNGYPLQYLPGKFQGQRSRTGSGPWGSKSWM